MTTKIYSFRAASTVTVLTAAQLQELVEERRDRGMNPERLAEFQAWHLAQLNQDGVPPLT